MTTPSRRNRLLTPALWGAGSLLVVELIVAATLVWPPTNAVAGNAQAAAVVPEAIAPPPAPTPETTTPTTSAPPTTTPPPNTPEPKPAPKPVTAPAEKPVKGQKPGTIRLPNGGTAKLVRTEVGSDAVLPVPDSLGEASWWGAGLDAPTGASLFAGHVNWKGKVGPFSELWNAKVNQPVTVMDHAGKPFNYRISQVITVHKDELPNKAPALFSQEGKHRVVLVTCGGRWIGGSTGYAENRIVIAEPA